jgi:Arc/MetJ-type ribon-helix-helix transcriptional regulator
MSQTNIQLSADITAFAGLQVTGGRFPSVSDYIHALVAADQKTQEVLRFLNGSPKLEALLEAGLASGKGRTWSPDVLREIKQKVVRSVAGNDG